MYPMIISQPNLVHIHTPMRYELAMWQLLVETLPRYLTEAQSEDVYNRGACV